MKRISALLIAVLLLACACAPSGEYALGYREGYEKGFDDGAASMQTPTPAPGAGSGATLVPGPPKEANRVLLERGGVKITYTGIDYAGIMGPALKLLIENDTDASVTVQARSVSVNGFMVSEIFSAEVAAGKKANDAITIMLASLEENDVKTLENAEFYFHVFRSDDWATLFDSDMVSIDF